MNKGCSLYHRRMDDDVIVVWDEEHQGKIEPHAIYDESFLPPLFASALLLEIGS